jgi:hypothetical protein
LSVPISGFRLFRSDFLDSAPAAAGDQGHDRANDGNGPANHLHPLLMDVSATSSLLDHLPDYRRQANGVSENGEQVQRRLFHELRSETRNRAVGGMSLLVRRDLTRAHDVVH